MKIKIEIKMDMLIKMKVEIKMKEKGSSLTNTFLTQFSTPYSFAISIWQNSFPEKYV